MRDQTSVSAPSALAGARPSFAVRPARVEDLSAVLALRRQAEALHARVAPDFFASGAEAGGGEEQELRAAIAGGMQSLWVAADTAGRVLGSCQLQVHDTPQGGGRRPTRRAHLELLVVEPSSRRGGCGRALYEAGMAWARRKGARQLVLTVWAGNADAERFYAALGMRVVGRVLGADL